MCLLRLPLVMFYCLILFYLYSPVLFSLYSVLSVAESLFVYSHVSVEVARLGEAEVAEFALVRLLAGVNAEVLCQRTRVGKSFFAHSTSERRREDLKLLPLLLLLLLYRVARSKGI